LPPPRARSAGKLSTSTFDADLAAANALDLLANHAALFTPNSGTLSGVHASPPTSAPSARGTSLNP